MKLLQYLYIMCIMGIMLTDIAQDDVEVVNENRY